MRGGGRPRAAEGAGIDDRHAETGRHPEPPVAAADAAHAGLPRLRAELHAVGFVVERVFELMRRIAGDLVDFSRMEADHRGARVHADPDVPSGSSTSTGTRSLSGRSLRDRCDAAILKAAHAGGRGEPDPPRRRIFEDRQHNATAGVPRWCRSCERLPS